MVEPQSIRPIDEPKRVFPTHLSHFSYRRHRKMGFGGKVEQVPTLPTVQIVFLWLVWMLRKKTAKVPPLNPEKSTFWSVVWKKFSIAYFLMRKRLVRLVLPYCNSVCAFAAVFSEKSPILGAKVEKTSFWAFLSVFRGMSASAQRISHRSCKNGCKVAQDLESVAT